MLAVGAGLLLEVEDASEEVDLERSLVEDRERGIERYSSRLFAVTAPTCLEEADGGIVETALLSGRVGIERLRLDKEVEELE